MKITGKNKVMSDEFKVFICKNDRGFYNEYEDVYYCPSKISYIVFCKDINSEEDVLEEYYELGGEELQELFEKYERELREEYIKYKESLEKIEE